jgi:hypothetical protein
MGQGARRFGENAAAGARGASETATAVDNSARAFERLERRFDPVIRAQARYTTNLEIIERAAERGSVSTERQVATIERLAKAQADAATAGKLLADAQGRGLITDGQRQQIMARTSAEFIAAERAARGYGQSIDGIGAITRRLLPLLAGLGAGLAATFGARAILKATIEQEDAIQQLGAAIASTGGIAGRSVSQLDAYSAALSKTTKFADEAIQAGQAQLLAFTNVRGSVFDRATADALDLATRKGIEVKAAMELVGRALDNPIRGMQQLRREGIMLSSSQQQLIKDFMAVGNVAGAQGVVLSELEKRYGGAAKAARDTLGGALSGLKNAIGDLLELNKVTTSPFKTAIEDVTKIISSPATKAAFDSFATGATKAFASIIQGATALTTAIGPAVKLIADNLGALATGFAVFTAGSVILGVATMAANVVRLGGAFQALRVALLAHPIFLIAAAATAAAFAVGALARSMNQIQTYTPKDQTKLISDATALEGKLTEASGKMTQALRNEVNAWKDRQAAIIAQQQLTIGKLDPFIDQQTTLRNPSPLSQASRDAYFAALKQPKVAAPTFSISELDTLGIQQSDRGLKQIDANTFKWVGTLDRLKNVLEQTKTKITDEQAALAKLDTQMQATAASTNTATDYSIDYGNAAKSAAQKAQEQLAALNAQADLLERTNDPTALRVKQKELELLADKYRLAGVSAEEMARRIVAAEDRVSANKISADIKSQGEALEQLTQSMSGGYEAFRTFQIAQEMAGRGAEKNAGSFLEAAKAARQYEKDTAAAERTAHTLEAIDIDPFKNFTASAQDAVAQFAKDFHDKGFDAVDSVGDRIKQTFKNVLNDFVFKSIFQAPLQALTGVLSGTGAGAGGGLASIFNFGGYGGTSATGSAPGGGLLGGGGILGTLGALSGLGGLLGGGGLITALQSPMLGNLAIQLGQALGFTATGAGSVLSGLGSIGLNAPLGILGNMGGGALANILGIKNNATNASVGGTVGGIAGSIFGPLGAIAGGALGNLLGGLFGPSQGTNAGVGLGFNPITGATFNQFDSGKGNSAQNLSVLQQAISALTEQTTALAGLGITFTEQVNAINMGGRDPTNVWYNPLGVTTANNTGARMTTLSTVGDTADLAKAVVTQLLSTATAADPKIQSILRAGLDADKTISILQSFQKIDQIMGSLKEPASAVAEALKAIGDTFTPIISELQSLGTAGAALTAVLQSQREAIDTVRTKWMSDQKAREVALLSPVAAQFAELLKVQAERLNDATLLGGGSATDLAKSVNKLELDQFATQAISAAGSIQNLNKAFDLLIANARAAGDAVQPIQDAFKQATAAIVENVNKQTAIALTTLQNPVLAQWQALQKQGQDAIAQAQALAQSAASQGLPAVDVQGVVTAAALQQSQFLSGLSTEDRQKLGIDVSAIQSLTDRMVAIVRDLDQAFTDDLAARKDWIEKTRQQAQDFIAAGQALSQLVSGQRDQYNPLTGRAQQADLQGRFNVLEKDALAGNLSAIQSIGQVGASLLEVARKRGASGADFQATFSDITRREQVIADYATQLGKTANDRADVAQGLIELENTVKTLAFGPSPNLAALQEMVMALGPTGTLAILLSQFIGTSAEIQGLPAPVASNIGQLPIPLATPDMTAIAQAVAANDNAQRNLLAGQFLAQPTSTLLTVPAPPVTLGTSGLTGTPETTAPAAVPATAAPAANELALARLHQDLQQVLVELRANREQTEGIRRDLARDPALRRAVGG